MSSCKNIQNPVSCKIVLRKRFVYIYNYIYNCHQLSTESKHSRYLWPISRPMMTNKRTLSHHEYGKFFNPYPSKSKHLVFIQLGYSTTLLTPTWYHVMFNELGVVWSHRQLSFSLYKTNVCFLMVEDIWLVISKVLNNKPVLMSFIV